MFEQELKEKYQFLTDYFEQGLKNTYSEESKRKLAHSILLYGQDIEAQYSLATEIARLLNCKEFQNDGCKCLNCNWVRERQHPAVMTISKLDNKPSDDDSKTVISIAQARMVKNLLLNTSDYHRVFIFCDAKMENEKWIPLGLNEQNFPEEAANSLLKSIEEPPENTTFFFLTRDKTDLIQTIISRSQSFFVPSYKIEDKDFTSVGKILQDYPAIERKDFLDLSQELLSVAKELGEEKILEEVQNYLNSLLQANLGNTVTNNKIISDIKHVETAKQMLNRHINAQTAFENMFLNFTQ